MTTTGETDRASARVAPGNPPEVSFWQSFIYSLGGIANGYMGNVLNVLAIPIFSMGLGVDAWLIGIGMAIPRVIDALVDPWIGHLSDGWRGRWGRRKPFLLLGGILTAVAFTLLWLADVTWSKNAIFGWFLVFSIIFYIGFALFSIPYLAMIFELADETRTRTRMLAMRSFVGTIAGFGIPWLYLMCFWDWSGLLRDGTMAERITALMAKSGGEHPELRGVLVVGISISVLMLASAICPLFCRDRQGSTKAAAHQEALMPTLKATFGNQPFLLMNLGMMLAFLGIFLVMPMTYFINAYHVFGGDKQASALMIGKVSTVQSVLQLIAVPVCAWVIGRLGTLTAMKLWLLLTAASFVAKFWCYTPTLPWLQLVPLGIWAFSWCGAMLCYNLLIGDACDYDDWKHGIRREGAYSAVTSLVNKIGMSVAVGLSGVLLSLSGVKEGQSIQGDGVIDTLRCEFAFIPAIFVIGALLVFIRYPLTDRRTREIREELRIRRGKV